MWRCARLLVRAQEVRRQIFLAVRAVFLKNHCVRVRSVRDYKCSGGNSSPPSAKRPRGAAIFLVFFGFVCLNWAVGLPVGWTNSTVFGVFFKPLPLGSLVGFCVSFGASGTGLLRALSLVCSREVLLRVARTSPRDFVKGVFLYGKQLQTPYNFGRGLKHFLNTSALCCG
jgi:hypothetical protein